ncbi:MAG TPA: family 1 glycosylhydrolase [Acidimicrobiales bacterium]|nr:family 1 glycosylhydrolase [Acidimicrobiales bacterium]
MIPRLGAVVGGFEEEGGFNGPGQPAHSWSWWEAEGRVARRPAGVWDRWDAVVAGLAAAGVTSVRIPVEWARCEPLDGRLDARAVAGYARLLDSCHEHGVAPVVVLHRFAHPAWMGVNFWLRPDAPERFCLWAQTAVEHFAGRTRRWVTIDQLNATALLSYLSGHHPPGRRAAVAATVRALDHLLAAHVLAYEAVKDRQPHGEVAMGTRHLPVYELDRLLVDVLVGRREAGDRHDLHAWLAGRRADFDASPWAAGGVAGRAVRRWAAGALPLEQALARTVTAVYDGAGDAYLDVLEVSATPGDVHRLLPLPPAVARLWRSGAGTSLGAACRAASSTGLPLAAVGDTPAGGPLLRRRRAEVGEAVAAGAPVGAYHQRLTGAALAELAAGRRAAAFG